jgi:hypothetical protein
MDRKLARTLNGECTCGRFPAINFEDVTEVMPPAEDLVEAHFTDVSEHGVGCNIRGNTAAMAFVKALYDERTPEGELRPKMSNEMADDLFRHARWLADVSVLMRMKNEQYGRTWVSTGWQAQLLKIWSKARRLMFLGWWTDDKPEHVDMAVVEDQLQDTVNHAFFMHALMASGNARGRLE